MSHHDFSRCIIPFFIKDPKVSEYEAKGNQLFQGLKTQHPDQLGAYSSWENVSSEEQGEIEAELPARALEPLKRTLLAQKIIEVASSIKRGAIKKISKSFPQDATKEKAQACFLSKELPKQSLSTNLMLELIEYAARTVAQLEKHKGDALQCAARAREKGRENLVAGFEGVSTKLEEVMNKFHTFAKTSQTENKQEDKKFYNKGLLEKSSALISLTSVLDNECKARVPVNPQQAISLDLAAKAANIAQAAIFIGHKKHEPVEMKRQRKLMSKEVTIFCRVLRFMTPTDRMPEMLLLLKNTEMYKMLNIGKTSIQNRKTKAILAFLALLGYLFSPEKK